MRDEDYVIRREGWLSNNNHPFTFSEGEEIEIYSSQEILNGTDLTGEEFPDFAKQAAKHFGEEVKMCNIKGILTGISYTYLDWYYIIQHSKEIFKCSCKNDIEFIEEKFGNLENLT